MTTRSTTLLTIFVFSTLAAMTLSHPTPPLHAEARFCTLAPGTTLALLRVEKDTTLAFAPAAMDAMSMSSVRESSQDTMLPTPSTQMPAGRVQLLQLDSSTRATLATHGITDSQPVAFIRAAPYRADCRTIRWTDTVPFVVRGEVGFVRATLAPRDQWIGGVPLLVIPDAWYYPYPRRRSLAYGARPNATLTSAEDFYSVSAALETPRPTSVAERMRADSAKRERAITWARANLAAAELEPARTLLRRAVLDPDWSVAERLPSRLRGTYRVDLEVGGERSSWFFRTHERPGYVWNGGDSLQTTATLLGSPHVLGYRLVGYGATALDSLPASSARGRVPSSLVWLTTTDRPTTPGNDTRRALPAILEFTLAGTPEHVWSSLEPFVPPMSVAESTMLARMNRPLQRGQKQAQLPITVRLDERGGIRADTSLTVGTRALRIVLTRVDTLSMKRPF